MQSTSRATAKSPARNIQDHGLASRRKRSCRFEAEAAVLLGLGMGLGETLSQDVEFRRSLGGGDAGPETSGHLDPVIRPRNAIGSVGQKPIEISERYPIFGIENEIESAERRRRDANDGEGPAGEPDGFARDVRIGGKTAQPK